MSAGIGVIPTDSSMHHNWTTFSTISLKVVDSKDGAVRSGGPGSRHRTRWLAREQRRARVAELCIWAALLGRLRQLVCASACTPYHQKLLRQGQIRPVWTQCGEHTSNIKGQFKSRLYLAHFQHPKVHYHPFLAKPSASCPIRILILSTITGIALHVVIID